MGDEEGRCGGGSGRGSGGGGAGNVCAGSFGGGSDREAEGESLVQLSVDGADEQH